MSFLSAAADFLGRNSGDLAGSILAAVGIALGYLAKRYLVPFLQVEKRCRYAIWIAAIADELIDDLKTRFPGEQWLQEVDRAVDGIVEICGIDREIALRAVRAAAARKQPPA